MDFKEILNIGVLIFNAGIFVGVAKFFMSKATDEIKEIKNLLNNHITEVSKDISEIKEKVAYIEGKLNKK
jgi:chaperonin cofactor prefoldin